MQWHHDGGDDIEKVSTHALVEAGEKNHCGCLSGGEVALFLFSVSGLRLKPVPDSANCLYVPASRKQL